MWKFTTYWFIMTLSMEVVITIGFWSFCYDAPHEGGLREVNLYMDHSVPILLLSLDFAFNKIWFELNQVWPNALLLLLYGFDNIIYTFATGHPVYPPLTWNSVTSISLGLCGFPMFLLFWLALCAISECKFKKCDMNEPDKDVLKNLEQGNKVAGGGSMDETDTVPCLTNKSNPEDVPFLTGNQNINISQSQSTMEPNHE
jgi:hypothetical protein